MLGLTKLQALDYDILPPAIVIIDYVIVIGLRKLEQRRPSAYQSSALPRGQTSYHHEMMNAGSLEEPTLAYRPSWLVSSMDSRGSSTEIYKPSLFPHTFFCVFFFFRSDLGLIQS